jgi:hypothetical protein
LGICHNSFSPTHLLNGSFGNPFKQAPFPAPPSIHRGEITEVKSKNVLILVAVALAIVFAVWARDIYQDRQVRIKVEAETGLYASEEDAFYNRTKPIRTIKPNEKVKVKRTTYGKDYWALFIETSDGTRGWVDSGQPGIVIIRQK